MLDIDLKAETLKLLMADHRPLHQIADESGVNYHWLGKLKQGKFDDPGVQRIQRLYNYLTADKAA